MKRVFSLAGLSVIVTGLDAQTKTDVRGAEETAKREILRLERERNQAIVKGDVAALRRMTADEYTFIRCVAIYRMTCLCFTSEGQLTGIREPYTGL